MHASETMEGMATPEQMAALAAAKGAAFDKLFLELMIDHHEGAVTMVENLLEQPGSAYDPVLFEFTSDVTNEQEAEIERMSALLVELSRRSEEHTSELKSLMRISYAVFCLKKKHNTKNQ